MRRNVDVLIIGAGIVGCAAARFLSRYQLNVLVIERGSDIAVGATKANSGILHSGYDCQPGTLKARLNIQGLKMYLQLAKELDIPYRINGSMVIDLGGADSSHGLQGLYERGVSNGVDGMEILSGEQARKLEPNLNPAVRGALRAGNAGVISPYEAAIAFAENAAENGVDFMTETAATSIIPVAAQDNLKSFKVTTTNGIFYAHTVINAAGVESGNIHNLVCTETETIQPQRGQYYLLDNTQRNLVTHTIFHLPTHLGKGVLIAPTVDYNILIGPTAENLKGRRRGKSAKTETTRDGLAEALEKAGLSLKTIPIRDRITAFAGVRAKHKSKDFLLEECIPGFINAIGVDSPGLTAAPAIAAHLGEMVLARHQPSEKTDFQPHRVGIKRFRELGHREQAELISQNPSYGRIVCRCETITEAEIIEAIRRPIGAKNLDALKRRTRAQMGRCQGGFCTLRLMEILSDELSIPETAVTKNGGLSGLCV